MKPQWMIFGLVAVLCGLVRAGEQEMDLAPKMGTYVRVDLTNQWAQLINDEGVVIWESIASTGREEKPTPTGTFQVTDKHKDWVSTIYGIAMPYFLRLNGGDIGLHAGPLPGYPGSAGCIRLPLEAAEELFDKVPVGTPVVIEGEAPTLEELRLKWKESRPKPYTRKVRHRPKLARIIHKTEREDEAVEQQ